MKVKQRQVELADVFQSATQQLRADRSRINELDRHNNNHGDNALNNFELVTNILNGMRGQDASTQLREASRVLQQQGRGATANIYSEGLLEAAQQLAGRSGIGLDDILPFLQGILGGAQRSTNAQPGQGSLMDSLGPAISAYMSARSRGLDNGQAIQEALNSAMRGSQQTYQQPSQYGRSQAPAGQSWQDPGAASATSLLEGIFKSVLGL